jgi:hypothetical protein
VVSLGIGANITTPATTAAAIEASRPRWIAECPRLAARADWAVIQSRPGTPSDRNIVRAGYGLPYLKVVVCLAERPKPA